MSLGGTGVAMKLYRKRPVTVEAWQLTEDNWFELSTWVLVNGGTVSASPNAFAIMTLEGGMNASRGDYIIRGIQGEFYPCKPDIFEASYETVL